MSFSTEYNQAIPAVITDSEGNLLVHHIHPPLEELKATERRDAELKASSVRVCINQLVGLKKCSHLDRHQIGYLKEDIAKEAVCLMELEKIIRDELLLEAHKKLSLSAKLLDNQS